MTRCTHCHTFNKRNVCMARWQIEQCLAANIFAGYFNQKIAFIVFYEILSSELNFFRKD